MANGGSVSIWRSPALACTFCLYLLMAAQSLGQPELSAPVNLSIKSHDFHTVLKWDVHNSSERTRFNVDFCEYRTAEWKPVCVNVSTHHCDLSNAFVVSEDQLGGYYARVKAVTAAQESKFAYTTRFTFAQNATLGAPILQLNTEDSRLIVAVKYPPLDSISNSVLWKSLYYNVYCRHPNQTNPVCLELTPENPSYQKDFVQGTVCVSAEVELTPINLIGKKSNETCLRMPQSNSSDSTILTWLLPRECEHYIYGLDPDDDDDEEYNYDENTRQDDGNGIHTTMSSVKDPENTVAAAAMISTTVVIVLLLIFIFIGIYLRKCKKKLVLPKSLAHIIVSERPYNMINPKHEESSVCVVVKPEEVTSVPDDSEHFQVQEETSITSDTVDPGSGLTDGGSSEHVDTDMNDPYAAKINIGVMDQNCDSMDHIDQEADSEQGNNNDLCKTNCNSIKLSCTRDNWGYDKPHVPLDMF